MSLHRIIGILLFLLSVPVLGGAQTWNKWNGTSVGSSTGNTSAMNGQTIGASTGNYSHWNSLTRVPSGGFTVVQNVSCSIAAAGSSTCALPSAVASGNAAFAVMTYPFNEPPTAATFNGVAPSPGIDSISYYQLIAHISNITTGGTTWSFTCPAACSLTAFEVSGGVTTADKTQTSPSDTTGTSWSSVATGTLSQSNEFVIGTAYCNISGNCGTSAVSSPFVLANCISYTTAAGDNALICPIAVSSTASITFSGTSTQAFTDVLVATYE